MLPDVGAQVHVLGWHVFVESVALQATTNDPSVPFSKQELRSSSGQAGISRPLVSQCFRLGKALSVLQNGGLELAFAPLACFRLSKALRSPGTLSKMPPFVLVLACLASVVSASMQVFGCTRGTVKQAFGEAVLQTQEYRQPYFLSQFHEPEVSHSLRTNFVRGRPLKPKRKKKNSFGR